MSPSFLSIITKYFETVSFRQQAGKKKKKAADNKHIRAQLTETYFFPF